MNTVHHRCLLLWWIAPDALMIPNGTNVEGFGYLDSLSTTPPSRPHEDSPGSVLRTTADYLDSLHDNDRTTHAGTTTSEWRKETTEDVLPLDHYARHSPGAGWAGYKHPMYGGYLDRLSGSETVPSTELSPSACVLPKGKKAEYGDDVRWGARVYLENL